MSVEYLLHLARPNSCPDGLGASGAENRFTGNYAA